MSEPKKTSRAPLGATPNPPSERFLAGRRLRCFGYALSALLALAIPSAADAKADREASLEHFKQADAYAKTGKLNEAVIELKNALQSDPDNIEARLAIGDIYLRQRNGPYAEKEFKAARERGYAADRIATKIARSYLLQGKFKDVIAEFDGDSVAQNRQFEILDLRGQALFALGRLDAAMVEFQTAGDLAPGETGPLVGQGRVLLATGRTEEANQRIDAALRLDPFSFDALVLKGQTEKMSGRLESSLKHFDAAIGVHPENIQALLPRAAVLIDLKRYDAALADIAAVEKQYAAHPVAGYLKALAFARQGKLDMARNALMSVKGLDNYPPALYLDATIAYSQQRYEQAAVSFRKFIQLRPEHLAAKRLLGATFLRSGEAEQTVRLLAPVAEQGTDDAQILTLLGSAYMSLGQYDKATRHYERAVDAAPKDGSIRTKLVVSKMAEGEHQAALEELAAALNNDPGAIQAAIMLAMNSLRAGRVDKAIRAANAVKAHYPKSPIGDGLLGNALLSRGDKAGARASFERALALDPQYESAAIALARLDIESSNLAAARGRFETALKHNSNSIAAMMGMAQLSLAEGKTEQSDGWIAKAIAANPDAVSPRRALIDRLISNGDFDKAALEANEFLRRNQRRAEAHELAGLVQLSRGDALGAVASFSQMATLAPGSAKAYLLKAKAEMAIGNPSDARRSLSRARELAPTDGSALAELIRLELKEGRLEEALRLAKLYAEKGIDPGPGYLALGDVYGATGNVEEARKAYEAGYRAAPSAEVIAKLFAIDRGLGEAQAGMARLRSWLKVHPNDAAIRLLLAGALIEAGDFRPALAEYDKLPAEQRNAPDVLNNVAWLYHQLKDPRAFETASLAYSQNPNSPEILDTLGWILLSRGNVKDALGHLRLASGMAPESAAIRYHLAAALVRDGKRQEAREILTEVVKDDVSFAEKAEARTLLAQISP